MPNRISFALAALLLSATAATAATAAESTADAGNKADAANAAKSAAPDTAAQASPTQRYCVVETLTGSHIPTRECHTRKEWMDLGFDPLAK